MITNLPLLTNQSEGGLNNVFFLFCHYLYFMFNKLLLSMYMKQQPACESVLLVISMAISTKNKKLLRLTAQVEGKFALQRRQSTTYTSDIL